MSDPALQGSVALVTGASSGIGEATALALSELGAAVAIAARRIDRLNDLAQRITAAGGTAHVIEADITDREQASAAVAGTVEHFGRLDMLVNNAGVMLLGPALESPLEDWERMVQINVNALLYCTYAALEHLIAAAADSPRKVADIVNVSSVAGRTNRPGSQVYNLTKHGVGAFSESLRQEVTRRHVRVTIIEPGAVATELRTHNRPEVQAQMEKRFGEIAILEPGDIAEAIAYCVTRPWRMSVNEVLIRPTEQAD
jgi:NADP-dependent 3-hydroxy acid dehydrogenase YdfG